MGKALFPGPTGCQHEYGYHFVVVICDNQKYSGNAAT